MEKFDFKKQYKDLYLPKKAPSCLEVPPMTFVMADGAGAPQGEAYQKALQALYTVAFSVKMSKMSGNTPAGYFDYVVPPLEGLWWAETGQIDLSKGKSDWLWTAMIRQPDFATQPVFEEALVSCRKKKPDIGFSGLRLETVTEGLCVQILHLGPYDQELRSFAQLRQFMEEQDLEDLPAPIRRHREIYLSDPRKTAPERLKTVLRLQVRKKNSNS